MNQFTVTKEEKKKDTFLENKIKIKKPNSNYLANKGFLCFDMHTHSSASKDSILTPRKILKKCVKNNFNIATTDHNTIKGAIKLQHLIDTEIAFNKVKLIPGIEITTEQTAHIIVYFDKIEKLTEFYEAIIEPNYNKKKFKVELDVIETIKFGREFGGYVSIPHPFCKLTGIKKIKHLDEEEYIHEIDFIETFNSHTFKRDNIKAIKWAEKHKKPIVGGTDSHILRTYGKTITYNKSSTTKEFLENISKGDSKILGEFDKLRFTIPCVAFTESIHLIKGNPIHRINYARNNIKDKIKGKVSKNKKGMKIN